MTNNVSNPFSTSRAVNQPTSVFSTSSTSQLSQPPREGYKHDDIVCDGCKKTPIFGIRYKCQLCHYFNLCHDCFSKSNHDFSHQFNAYRRPMNYLSTT